MRLVNVHLDWQIVQSGQMGKVNVVHNAAIVLSSLPKCAYNVSENGQAFPTFPLAPMHAALTVVSHTCLPYHIYTVPVPVRPIEMAPWQRHEWIIALLASRTHHAHDSN